MPEQMSSPQIHTTVVAQKQDSTQTQVSLPGSLSVGREILSRSLPPILALVSIFLVWWGLYFLYPRLLPGPLSTFHEAIRLLSDGTFFFHMLQSLRRVFVGATVAMIFSIAVGIYMGTVLMGERFFQPLVVLGLTIPGLMWALIAVMLF